MKRLLLALGFISATVFGSGFLLTGTGSGTGTVTDVTATLPLLSTGGTTPDISMTQSDASTDGWLSAIDWNTFNNKQATLTLGNIVETGSPNLVVSGGTGAIVGSGVSLALTGASIVEATSSVLSLTGATNAVLGTGVSIQVKQAAASQSGYLSSADWNSFAAKQAGPLTGDVTTSGAAATLATVNSNVGSFTYGSLTVNAKGLITAASSGATPEVPLTFSTGLTRSVNTVTVNTSQNISTLSNLTANGFVKTSGGVGTLSVDTSTYLTGNQTITLSGDATGSGATSIATTLATVNSNVGSFTNANITVNAKGLITAAANGSAGGAATLFAPTVTNFSAGSGTFNQVYWFVITSGSATVGSTYTNNSITFTTYATVASATRVAMSGAGPPTTTGTLTKASGTGDATLTFSAFAAPLYDRVIMVGGGGGGGGSQSGGSAAGNGSAGNNSTFGSSLLTANGGGGGPASAGSIAAGGTATIASPAYGIAVTGGAGGGAGNTAIAITLSGGMGGASFFGGAGSSAGNVAGSLGVSGTGGGGGGGGTSGAGVTNNIYGGGGGAGGYLDAIIPSPSATYAYVAAAVASAGTAGTSGFQGGQGASGSISVWCYYQ